MVFADKVFFFILPNVYVECSEKELHKILLTFCLRKICYASTTYIIYILISIYLDCIEKFFKQFNSSNGTDARGKHSMLC